MNITSDPKTGLERFKKAKDIHQQVIAGIDRIMGMVEPGKSRQIGQIPFVSKQESAIARCLVTLLQLKHGLEKEFPGVEIREAG